MVRSIYCYECKAVKENPTKGYCRACNRKRDNEWRSKTGRTRKHQTGLCPCGKERAPYSPGYCIECIAIRSKERRKKHPYTAEQIAHRNELQKKRYREKRGEKKVKLDPFHQKQRQRYHDNSPEAIESRLKHQVRALTRSFIKSGKLIRGMCEVCGELKVDAHHDDYSKPMDIRWLCKKHHVEHHKNVSCRT